MTSPDELRSMTIAMMKVVARQEHWTRAQRRNAEATLERQPAHTLAAEFAHFGERWQLRRGRLYVTNDERFADRTAIVAVRQSRRTAAAVLNVRRAHCQRDPRSAKT